MSERIGHIEKTVVTPHKDASNGSFGEALDYMRESRNKAIKGFINNKGLFVGIILVFIVILAFTTNINFTSSAEVVKLSLAIFIFMFCSYSMYVNCADSGMRAGKATSLYINTKAEYDKLKKQIIDENKQTQLGEFCRFYVEEELKNTRKDIINSVGLSYEEYTEKWVWEDAEKIKNNSALSERVKSAIIRANEIKPVKLTSEMILKRERGNKRRAPLGVRPETVKTVNYSIKLVTTISISIFTCMLALEAISDPSWATWAELFIKVFMVILSGFTGYKMGYENIVISTVNYTLDQTDLLSQFIEFLSEKNVTVADNADNEGVALEQ